MDEPEWRVVQLPTVMPRERKARLKSKRRRGKKGETGTATIRERRRRGKDSKA